MTGHLGRRALVSLIAGGALAAIAVVPHAAASGDPTKPTCTIGYSRGQVHDIVNAYAIGGQAAGRKLPWTRSGTGPATSRAAASGPSRKVRPEIPGADHRHAASSIRAIPRVLHRICVLA